jgi:LemA protein
MGAYSRIVRLRQQVVNGWRLIDAHLKRRHDLLPNLVTAVKETPRFEWETLDALVAARARAVNTTGPADAAVKEGELTEALARVFTLAGKDPQLAANHNVRALQEAFGSFDTKLAAARKVYNGVAATYNAAIQGFPGNIIAGFANFKAAELFAEPPGGG